MQTEDGHVGKCHPTVRVEWLFVARSFSPAPDRPGKFGRVFADRVLTVMHLTIEAGADGGRRAASSGRRRWAGHRQMPRVSITRFASPTLIPAP